MGFIHTQDSPSVGQRILNAQKLLSPVPGGNYLFNRIIAWNIPYSATIGARILELRPGYARLTLKDRRSVRNHLNSIHAVALTNFGEFTSGLALITGLPANVRAIVTQIKTDFIKKARGHLKAECHCDIPDITGNQDYTVSATITDAINDTVATVSVVWRLGIK